jgi:hypothetical protein
MVVSFSSFKRRDERKSIKGTAIMMDLALDTLKFSAVDVVPVG